MITILKELRIAQLCSKNGRTLRAYCPNIYILCLQESLEDLQDEKSDRVGYNSYMINIIGKISCFSDQSSDEFWNNSMVICCFFRHLQPKPSASRIPIFFLKFLKNPDCRNQMAMELFRNSPRILEDFC